MDTSGSNRYKLLFMDDDSVRLPADSVSATDKNRQANVTATKNSTASNAKKNLNFEKENKSGALNKKAVASPGKPTAGVSATSLNKNHTVDGESRRVSFKSHSSKVHEQGNNRRNLRQGGPQASEFGSDQCEPRQFRDRDNRCPPRNREGLLRWGKREFDRQSGSDKTGVKAVDKRDGAGAHNWGSVQQEIDDINKSNTDAGATLTDKEDTSNEHTPEKPAVPEEADEEDVKELTLDEWKALRGERNKPRYNIRKPNEGEDTSQWKKMVVLNKKKDGDSEEEYEYDPSMYPQRVGRLQRIVDIQFNFNDGHRGGGGFGKGRERGLRPGGDNKEPRPDGDRQSRQQRNFGERQHKRSTPNALKVDDERQFPTLS